MFFSLQGSTVSTKSEPALQIQSQVTSTGMTKTSIIVMIKGAYFLLANMERTPRFTSAVRRVETKLIPLSSPLKIHSSCQLMGQKNVRWSNGRLPVWSGYVIILKTRTTRIKAMGRTLTMLEQRTQPFTTVITVVSNHTHANIFQLS